MAEPFFQFIVKNLRSVSSGLYGKDNWQKYYGHVDYISLPVTAPPEQKLGVSLLNRKSTRSFSKKALDGQVLVSILYSSIAKNANSAGEKHYPFPSGGGLYPIETYLYIDNVLGYESGIYHYASDRHSLGLIKKCQLNLRQVNEFFGGAFDSVPQALVIMTMVKSRMIFKYGYRTYLLSLIEAGHRAQNICLCAAAYKAGVCTLAGGVYTPVNDLLGLDGINEHYIYALAVGEQGC